MQTRNVLGPPEIMCMLLAKLPRGTRNKWLRRVLLIRRKQGREPEPADFIDFVNDENLIVNDPDSLTRLRKSTLTRKQNQEGLQHLYQDQRIKSVDLTSRSTCVTCGENRQSDGCLKFMDMALKDRINY